MDAIRRIIAEITFICRTREVPVSDTLAAFVAHSVVLGQPEQFPLDRELNEADVQELVHVAVERLLAADSASLETIKMQVAFDIAKLEEADALKAAQGAREEREGSLLAGIVDARLKDGNNDVEALTALYRRIFNYLVVRAGLELGADRPAEREIAAALESVFPRIGLKPFTHLPAEDKGAQLHELANIVLGIRLFNRALGKGGAGIADHAALGRQRASELLHGAGSELEQVGQLCEQYAEVLSFRHGPHRQEALRALDAPSRARDAARTVRLQEELANRRQYGASLSDLFGGLQASAKRLAQLERAQAMELESLSRAVGSQASVPKEEVYPRFDALAKLWAAFEEEAGSLGARKKTLEVLGGFRASFAPQLSSEDVSAARAARRALAAASMSGDAVPVDARILLAGALRAEGGGAGAAGGASYFGVSASVADASSAAPLGAGDGGALPAADFAERLAAPEGEQPLLQRSLELEGYCPVTLVDKAGLLLPGSAACVVRYAGRHYACVDDGAARAFEAAADKYAPGVLAIARRSPELIHLLRLQEHFPGAALSEMMARGRARPLLPGSEESLGAPERLAQDAQVQTQVHLAERHIDRSYEFSEWALRRRALQLANLRGCATKSAQTAQSHFRRETQTQVFLPRESDTQTGITAGTEAPRMVNYVKGLRGHPDSVMHVVNLTIDPGAARG